MLERFRHLPPAVVRRALRAAVVLPAVTAVGIWSGSDLGTTFAAFGFFAAAVMADFTGTRSERSAAYLGVLLIGALAALLGTVLDAEPVLAVVGAGLVAFGIRYVAVLGGYIATGHLAALVGLALGVMSPGGVDTLPERLVGWSAGVAAALVASLVLWPPAPQHGAARQAAALARAVAGVVRDRTAAALAEARHRRDDAQSAVLAGPYRPAGPGQRDLGLLECLLLLARAVGLAERFVPVDPDGAPDRAVGTPAAPSPPPGGGEPLDEAPVVAALRDAVVGCLDAAAAALDGRPAPLSPDDLVEAGTAERAAAADGAAAAAGDPSAAAAVVADARATFPLRALAVVVEQLVVAVGAATGRPPSVGRTVPGESLLPVLPAEPLSARAARLLRTHLRTDSPALRNAVRAGVAFAGAVAATEVTGLGHAFWVALAVLAVLRSDANGTGSQAVAAVGGTLVGFGLAVVVLAVATEWSLGLWVALPVVTLGSVLASGTGSVAAGQAGFAVLVVVLVDLLSASGWETGVVRVEAVAMGALVAVAAGLLFWPRGAASVLRASVAAHDRAVAEEIRRVSAALAHQEPLDAAHRAVARSAETAAVAREALADDLAQGGHAGALPAWAPLLRAPTAVDFGAVAVLGARRDDLGPVGQGPCAAADHALQAAADAGARWFDAVGEVLERADGPAPADPDEVVVGWRVDHVALERDLVACVTDGGDADAALRRVWAADWLAVLADLTDLVRPALAQVVAQARRPWWRERSDP